MKGEEQCAQQRSDHGSAGHDRCAHHRKEKQEDKLKQERIRKKILERLDKDYILPKRRVCTRFRPKDLNKGIVNKTESKMDEFKQLITYDSDF